MTIQHYVLGAVIMNSIIVGNGINIQFGGLENLNHSIINRAINNVEKGTYPSDVYPKETAEALPIFCAEIPSILKGGYDGFALTSSEKEALSDFKNRYLLEKKYEADQVGFEDYYFIFDLVARKTKLVNPERYHAREGLKCFFIDAIFNNNEVNRIYENFPFKLKQFFREFNNIFTTNYDENIDIFTGEKILHLHGSFDILAEVYNPKSFINKIPNPPMRNYKLNENYMHLYSNVLTSYSGFNKDFSMHMHDDANSAVEKLVAAYAKDEKVKVDIDSWADEENDLVRNMYYAVMCKIKDPQLKFTEYYPFTAFQNIKGVLTFVGLSPYNDTHLFRMVNNNSKLEQMIFYYYNDAEMNSVKQLVPNCDIEFIDVRDLWKRVA